MYRQAKSNMGSYSGKNSSVEINWGLNFEVNQKRIILASKANHRHKIGCIFNCIILIFIYLMILGQLMLCCIEMIQIYHFKGSWGIPRAWG